MSAQATTLEDLDLDNFDINELVQQVEANQKLRGLRKENPWVRDIIRILWASKSSVTMDRLTRELWSLRSTGGLPMPKKFRETIQSALNHHTSQSKVFKGPPGDDLFFSPNGKGSGTWSTHRPRALAWLQARKLPEA